MDPILATVLAEPKYSIALGQMPEDTNGRRPQALILYANDGRTELLRIPYAEAGDALLKAFAPHKLNPSR